MTLRERIENAIENYHENPSRKFAALDAILAAIPRCETCSHFERPIKGASGFWCTYHGSPIPSGQDFCSTHSDYSQD